MDQETLSSFNYNSTIILSSEYNNNSIINIDSENNGTAINEIGSTNLNNYWALFALVLVLGTAAGNILVCLAITWERRLHNVTNYFLMSLAVTDLMVAILVMPLGILTLVKGRFSFDSEHCLVWICLDVLFCTASIMHLCTISIDRYLSLRYPIRFGRNKTRKRVIVKLIFVWILSIAMSLPLSLMYSKSHSSVLVNGICQIPDPVYKLVGSIICFYIPLLVMLITYYLTVRLLARQKQHLGGNQQTNGWSSGWLGQSAAIDRRCTWRRLLKTNFPLTPHHSQSAVSTDTDLSTLDSHELWIPDSSMTEPLPSTMSALHQFGAEMVKLSHGLESASSQPFHKPELNLNSEISYSPNNNNIISKLSPTIKIQKRRSSNSNWISTGAGVDTDFSKLSSSKRCNSLDRALNTDSDESNLYLIDKNINKNGKRKENIIGEASHHQTILKPLDKKILPKSRSFRSAVSISLHEATIQNLSTSDSASISITTATSTSTSTSTSKTSLHIMSIPQTTPARKLSYSKGNSVVTWDTKRNQRRGSSFGGARTSLLLTSSVNVPNSGMPLRRSATLRNHNNINNSEQNIILNSKTMKVPSSPCLLQRSTTIRSHHSRNSSVISKNSSRHGRIIRLEQKATKVLGVVFFTFVILWAPFFVLNLLPSLCMSCEENISPWVFEFVTWLGYASSMVNPIFYTIFNKVFRQAFKKVLLCQYGKDKWRPHR